MDILNLESSQKIYLPRLLAQKASEELFHQRIKKKQEALKASKRAPDTEKGEDKLEGSRRSGEQEQYFHGRNGTDIVPMCLTRKVSKAGVELGINV